MKTKNKYLIEAKEYRDKIIRVKGEMRKVVTSLGSSSYYLTSVNGVKYFCIIRLEYNAPKVEKLIRDGYLKDSDAVYAYVSFKYPNSGIEKTYLMLLIRFDALYAIKDYVTKYVVSDSSYDYQRTRFKAHIEDANKATTPTNFKPVSAVENSTKMHKEYLRMLKCSRMLKKGMTEEQIDESLKEQKEESKDNDKVRMLIKDALSIRCPKESLENMTEFFYNEIKRIYEAKKRIRPQGRAFKRRSACY